MLVPHFSPQKKTTMNLETLQSVMDGVAAIAKGIQFERQGGDFNTGVTELHRRIDNYICGLISAHGGEVIAPEVFRYIEVRQRGAGALHREPAQEPGSMAIWDVRIKQLEQEFTGDEFFVDLYEYDTEQILSTVQEPELKIPWDDFPNWVQWVAMDFDNDWFQYENKPVIKDECQWWFESKKGTNRPVKTKRIPFTAPDWRTSLRQRPAKTTEQ